MPGEPDEVEFLSRAALELGESGPEDALFQTIADRLAQLTPQTLVLPSRYDPDTGIIVVRSVAGPDDMKRLLHDLVGPLEGQSFLVDQRGRELLGDGKLVRVEDGLYRLIFSAWPRELSRNIEAQLGIRSVHAQSFLRKGAFVGGVAFLSRLEQLEHLRLIEVFARLAAVAIQRQSAEAELSKSEHRFRTLAENSQDVICRLRVAPKLALEYVNPAAGRLIGRPPEELYRDARLAAPCLFPEEWARSGMVRDVPRQPVVARCSSGDGRVIWMEQNFTPIRDASGQLFAVDCIARDITHRKATQDALIEADRRKTEFIAVLSHELRNPLGAISSGVHVLQRAEPGDERAKRAMGVIDRQLAQLTRLVDDLLDVTRITRGKLQIHRQRVDASALVWLSVEDHQAAFRDAGVDLEVVAPAEVFICADPARIRQVFDNLLDNAAKFTPAGGRATVSMDADTVHEQAVLRVHNTGEPLSTELLGHLFEPFVQADQSLDRRKGGLGLGLALVKEIVERHGGTVQVESEPDRGTTFTVRLRLDASCPA